MVPAPDFGSFYDVLISFYARGARGGSIELHEVERLVTNCRSFRIHLRSDFLWQELEGGLCSQSLVRSLVCSPTDMTPTASGKARQTALLNLLVVFDFVESEMARDGVSCSRIRFFAQDMRKAIQLPSPNSGHLASRDESRLLPLQLMSPSSEPTWA